MQGLDIIDLAGGETPARRGEPTHERSIIINQKFEFCLAPMVGSGGSKLPKILLIDNYDSYTFNLYQLIAAVNGGMRLL